MTASYCTIAELKLQDHLNITDADSDASLGDIIGNHFTFTKGEKS